MRTVVRVILDVQAGNAAVKNGTLSKLVENAMDSLKPEAAYFFADHGKRSMFMVFDLKDQADIPAIAEPFFMETNASVEFYPCMNAEDLKKGLDKTATAREFVGA